MPTYGTWRCIMWWMKSRWATEKLKAAKASLSADSKRSCISSMHNLCLRRIDLWMVGIWTLISFGRYCCFPLISETQKISLILAESICCGSTEYLQFVRNVRDTFLSLDTFLFLVFYCDNYYFTYSFVDLHTAIDDNTQKSHELCHSQLWPKKLIFFCTILSESLWFVVSEKCWLHFQTLIIIDIIPNRQAKVRAVWQNIRFADDTQKKLTQKVEECWIISWKFRFHVSILYLTYHGEAYGVSELLWVKIITSVAPQTAELNFICERPIRS